MNREELRKKFNKYTKEQILDGIFYIYLFNNEIETLLNKIEFCAKQKRIEDDHKEFERAFNNVNKATDNYLNYTNELKNKYGKIVLGELTKEEFDKLLELTSEYEKTNAEYLKKLEKDIKRY